MTRIHAHERVSDALARAMEPEAQGLPPQLVAHGNPREFVDAYQLLLDRRRFSWDPIDGYPHMVEIYESTSDAGVVMAGAQVGKTGMVLARLVWLMIRLWGRLFGYYFPDKELPKAFSTSRFAPFVRGNGQLRPWVGASTQEGKGSDGAWSRTIGPSRVFFLGTEGTTSTESMPFQAVIFDEVRRMRAHAIQLAEERLSGQIDPVNWKVSTARYPREDIHRAFLRGDQRYWHSECKCPDGVVLSERGRDSILDLRGATPATLRKAEAAFDRAGLPAYGLRGQEVRLYGGYRAAFWCSRCGEIVANPRLGWWEAHAVSGMPSWQLSQVVTPTMNAPKILHAIEVRSGETLDEQEVSNSKWGLPFLDERRQLVSTDELLGSVRPDAPWSSRLSLAERRQLYPRCVMGVDVQQGYLVAVVKAPMPGRWRTVHVEVCRPRNDDGGWGRLGQMMEEFGVVVAVIDAQPMWNEAVRFAKAFIRRVWLCYYTTQPTAAMVRWNDATSKKKKDQKGSGRFKYTVLVQQIKTFRWALGAWRLGLCEIPTPRGLAQVLPRLNGEIVLSPDLAQGRDEPCAPAELYLHHLTRVIVVNTADVEDVARKGSIKEELQHVGIDPHFAHAEIYASAAASRMGGSPLPPPEPGDENVGEEGEP